MTINEKRGRGRPPIPESERRGNYPTVPLSDSELSEIQVAAERSGSMLATWMREVLLRAARRGSRKSHR